jgi:hypothetical protein
MSMKASSGIMVTSSVNEEATISQPREGGTLFVTAFGTLLRDRRQVVSREGLTGGRGLAEGRRAYSG